MQALNPMYRRDVVPAKKDKPYPIVLPENKICDFIDKDTLIFAYEREKFFPNNTLNQPNQFKLHYSGRCKRESQNILYRKIRR